MPLDDDFQRDLVCTRFVSVGDLLAKQARTRAAKTALRDGERSWTYLQLDHDVSRLANHLIAAGVRRGDRIAILSRNSSFYLRLALAAARTGSILATLNWRLSPEEIAFAVALVEPRLLFHALDYTETVAGLDHCILIDNALEHAVASFSCDAPVVAVEAEDGHLIIYTSGTTGFPKAAVISQRAMLARLNVHFIEYGFDHEDVFLCWSPMFHTAAIDLAIATLLVGGSVVMSDGMDFDLMCDLLENEKLSNLMFFPGMIDDMIARLQERRPRVRGIKKFGAFADLVKPRQIADLTRLLGVPYANTFGMTEAGTSPASAGFLPIGVEPENLAKRENVFCDMRLVDESDSDVAPGTPGELLLRGPVLFSGYWNDPQATHEAFRGGWYHTGDVFLRHEDGTLSYSGRRKYLIKSGGENIYPAEIERVILAHPDVTEAIVVAAADDIWGEVPIAVIAAQPGVDLVAVANFCTARMARFKRPKDILLVEHSFFPRNNTGKVIRKAVEAWVMEQRQRSTFDHTDKGA